MPVTLPPLTHHRFDPFAVRDRHLVDRLPPPELFALLFFGISILLLLVTHH